MTPSFSGTPACLGVFTDVQYANKDNITLELYDSAVNEQQEEALSVVRHYSQVLAKTANAINHFNSSNVVATLHLGDIVDGNKSLSDTRKDLEVVTQTFRHLRSPVLHAFGNHCLSAGRDHLCKALGFTDNAYYTFDVSSKWRLIVLDTVDISVDRDTTDPLQKIATDYIAQHPNDKNAQHWNGGLSSAQKLWLKSVLQKTRKEGKLAVVCGHIPILMEDTFGPIPPNALWDFESVASIFDDFKDVVKAYFAGHYHQGGYVQKNGIHYVIFESVLDSQHQDGSCGLVHLFDDGIEITGHGEMTSRHLPI